MFPAPRSVFIHSASDKWSILREYLFGLRHRRGESKSTGETGPEPAKVRKFFEARSSVEGFTRVTDAGKGWYLDCIAESPVIGGRLVETDPVNVLDIGCSRGSLLAWLRDVRTAPFRYLGTDLDQVAVANCKAEYQDAQTDFMVENILEPQLSPARRFDIVFCINVLSYIQDLASVAETLMSRCVQPDGLLVVMDPVPSPYWNTVFGGFRTALRQPEEWDRAVTRAGGTLVDSAVLYTLNILGSGKLPIAAMCVWHAPGD